MMTINCLAPALPDVLYIKASAPIESYQPLLNAIFTHESAGDQYAFNAKEGAVGPGQVRQIRVDHYNDLTGNKYCLADFYSYELTEEIFLYFTCHDSRGREIPCKSWEQAAKDWNGAGPMTEEYWNNIKSLL